MTSNFVDFFLNSVLLDYVFNRLVNVRALCLDGTKICSTHWVTSVYVLVKFYCKHAHVSITTAGSSMPPDEAA